MNAFEEEKETLTVLPDPKVIDINRGRASGKRFHIELTKSFRARPWCAIFRKSRAVHWQWLWMNAWVLW